MMILKKMFLLICLGLGAFVPGVCANELKDKVDKQINGLVAQVFVKDAQGKSLNAAWLKTSLTKLKASVLQLLANHEEEYKDLHQALTALNLESDNLPEVLPQLKTVVNNLPEKSKKFLKAKFSLLA